MNSQCMRVFGPALLLVMAVGLAWGCTPKVTTGAFTQVQRIDVGLQRGKSSKMDVQRLLGAPKGSGNAVLPTDPRLREIWFYDDIELENMSQEAGIVKAKFRQQVLFVLFDKGVFDGYMWWSNAGEAKQQ